MPAAHSVLTADVQIRHERPEDSRAVDRLVADAFGPGRFVKSAERVREGRAPALDISLVAWDGPVMAGCVRQWPVRIGQSRAVLLGPFAVAEVFRGKGLGGALIRAACEAAEAAGYGIVLLVGDEPFFRPLGFQLVEPGRVVLPGPVNPRRVLWRALAAGALDGVTGPVAADD